MSLYTYRFYAVIAAALMSSYALAEASISAVTIVQRADEVRNPSDSYFLEVAITHKEQYAQTFYVAIEGHNQTRIETVAPDKDRGRNMLMIDQNMWVFLPSLGRETRVALNQKLIGQAANGDLSRLRWSGDYLATLVSETQEEWELLLESNKPGLTYDKMRLWVEKGSFHPLRAHYLTPAGKILKRVSYEQYQMMAGEMRPTRLIIEDAIRPKERSIIQIMRMQVRTFSPLLFHKSEMGRLLLDSN